MKRGRLKGGDETIPFVAIGKTGWKTEDTLRDKARELVSCFEGRAPHVSVIQLEPPAIAVPQGDSVLVKMYDHDRFSL